MLSKKYSVTLSKPLCFASYKTKCNNEDYFVFCIKNDSFPCVIEKLYLTLPTIICVNVYNVCSLLIRLYILMFV